MTTSTSASPSVPWIEADSLERHLEGAAADPAVKTFARDLSRDGLAVFDLGGALDPLCDRVTVETAHHFNKRGVTRVHDAWRRSPAIRTIATLPAILERLSLAYGRRPFPFQSLNFLRGSQQDPHSDALHFHSQPERFMCGVWVALEDVRPEAGPLLYYPGSHRLPVLTMQDVGAGEATVTTQENYNERYGPALLAQLDKAGITPTKVCLKKGQVAVWTANLAHGGSPILDPQSTRRSLVIHYFFDDCVYLTPMLSTPRRPFVRLPANIATGGWVWPRRDGRRVGVPLRRLFISAMERLFKITPRY